MAQVKEAAITRVKKEEHSRRVYGKRLLRSMRSSMRSIDC